MAKFIDLQVEWLCFAFAMLIIPSPASAQLPPANPIQAVMPRTTLALELETVIRLPDSASGSNRFARIEQISPSVDGSDRMWVADQRGKLFHFSPGDSSPTEFFDFGANIPNFRDGNQSGLRSFAFHPNAFNPGADGFRKMYTAQDVNAPGHTSVVSEWTLDANGGVIASSRRDILSQSQPRGDHNIGKIGFNPNLGPSDFDYGNLYVSFGDGGNYRSSAIGGSDSTLSPEGQDTTNFLGSILRIDPLQDGTAPYRVPDDNPFVGQPGFEPELWAYGLRNPHHFGWDIGGTGRMLIADIGQSNIEEVNLGVAGANYGWSVREGTFDMTGKAPDNPISAAPLPADHIHDAFTYPVVQYDHDFDNSGQISAAIAGGYVYRGSLIPELRGKYIFGNFSSDNEGSLYIVDEDQLHLRDDFTTLPHNGFLAPVQQLRLQDENNDPTTLLQIVREASFNNNQNRTDMRFGIDNQGEIYISSKKDGWVRRFVSTIIPGDYNRDGQVDAADFTIWRDALGSSDPWADGDGDGLVTFNDYALWLNNFGSSNPSFAVPEPDGSSTLLTCVLFLLHFAGRARRTRRKSLFSWFHR